MKQANEPEYVGEARQQLIDSMRTAVRGTNTYVRGRLPVAWINYLRGAEVEHLFGLFEDKQLVRVELSDDDCSWEDIMGDMFNEEHASTIPGGHRTLEKQKKDFEQRVYNEGLVSIDCYYEAPDGDDVMGASIGGFVGVDDAEESGYMQDYKLETMQLMFDHYGTELPDYFPSKTGEWTAVAMAVWRLHGGRV